MGVDGYIYATSASGGSGGNGTVFQIEPSGAWLQMLYNFSSPLTDGRILYCALAQGTDGYLYGTTSAGGTTANGTVFRLATYGGDFSVLHQFGVSAPDGKHPRSGVLADADGWFYGTTEQGGTAGTGTVYRVQASGNYQVLHHFLGAPVDGARPYAELVRAADGFLYGTCREGGPTGDGIIFRLNSDGSGYGVSHALDNSRKEGRYPQSRLILAGTEGLYGVTTAGGIASTGGTLFRVGLDGSYFTVLHTFGVDTGDGVEPNALTLAQDGALLGATRIGGNWSKGTVLRVLPLSIEPLTARVVAAFGAGQMNLEIHGRPKTTYWVEATTDLARGPWASIGTPVATSILGVAQVRDSQPFAVKYYRVVTAAAP
jgi:uncharacterized repeat protein (TIGR03803 family)